MEASSISSKEIFKQSLLSICVSMSYFCIGLVRGYSASAVPSINDTYPELLPNKNIASWASSIPPFGAFFGSLVAWPLLHHKGRKFPIMLAAAIWLTSWTIIALAPNWKYLMGARMMSGFCAGLVLPSAQIYVTECSNTKIRGIIGSFPGIFMSVGILSSYIIGYFLPWNYLAWSSALCAVFLSVLVCFLPESPVWLKTQNEFNQEQKSKKWLGLDILSLCDIKFEIDKKEIKSHSLEAKNDNHIWKELLTRPILLPLAIGLTILAIQQLSGIDAIIFFSVEIFRTSGSSINGNLAAIIIGTVQLGSNILSLFVVDRAGRKVLLITSGIIMSISNASMGLAFYLNGIGKLTFGYLPLISLMVFMFGFSFGFGCIPFLLIGELFPTKQRSLLSSIAGSFNLGIMFIVIKTYHPLEEMISTAGTFWMYSVLCALGVVFVITCVPETKGRDFESIAKLFTKSTTIRRQNMVRDEQMHANINYEQINTNENIIDEIEGK